MCYRLVGVVGLITSVSTNFARITKMREQCGTQWDDHWSCLQKRNQEYFKCRQPERKLNECMFEKLVCLLWFLLVSLIFISAFSFQGLTKTIPGSPDNQPPVHEKLHPIYKPVQK